MVLWIDGEICACSFNRLVLYAPITHQAVAVRTGVYSTIIYQLCFHTLVTYQGISFRTSQFFTLVIPAQLTVISHTITGYLVVLFGQQQPVMERIKHTSDTKAIGCIINIRVRELLEY